MKNLQFAELDNRGRVLRVVVVRTEDLNGATYPESESLGVALLNKMFGASIWVQSDPHGEFRRRPAGPGLFYDRDNDVFLHPQPFPSWLINDSFDWVAPVPMPDDTTQLWIWNENDQTWDGRPRPIDPVVETLGE